MDRGLTVPNDRYDRHDRDDRKEPRQRGRRDSMTRANDRSVERRGFGIRPESKDRFGRGSDESFERQKQYRDSGYAVPEPHRRDTAPELNYHEERRMEQEKRDRVLAQQIQDAERERAERETRDREQRDREIPEPRRREEDRNYDRGYDRGYDREHDRPRERDYDHDVDRERERERQRMMEPQPPQQPQQPRHEPHHHRRESNRDFPQDYSRKENGQREGSETQAQPGLSSAATAATAGLAGAAATFGLGKVFGKDKDKDDRDNDKPRDRDRDGDRDSDRERKREKRRERERDSDRGYDGPRDAERERRSPRFDVPPQERRSDEGVHFQQDRHGGSDAVDQGLGFAFERAREPPRSGTAPPAPAHDRAPPVAHRDDQPALNRERPAERDTERDHDKYFAEAPKPSGDADEDYRRRMEQVQRELGVKGVEERASDSDPDRERRRREREQRRNERRDMQNANGVDPGPRNPNSAFAQYPEPGSSQRNYEDRDFDDRGSDNRSFENRSFENRSFENDSVNGSTASRPSGLTRKRSILDQPMNDEPVQIIDNSMSERRENRVRIVDPPTEEEDKKPRGILKRPTDKFPETANVMREGVAPLKDVSPTAMNGYIFMLILIIHRPPRKAFHQVRVGLRSIAAW